MRDFVQTRPLIHLAESVFGESAPRDPNVGVASRIATINPEERGEVVQKALRLLEAHDSGQLTERVLAESARRLVDSKVRLTPAELASVVTAELDAKDQLIAETVAGMKPEAKAAIDECMDDPQMQTDFGREEVRRRECSELWREEHEDRLAEASDELAEQAVSLTAPTIGVMVTTPGSARAAVVTNNIIIAGRQVNPEFIVNIDAGAIVFFQVLVSYLMGGYHRFTTMIVGMVIAAIGIGLPSLAGGEGMVGIGALVWFAAAGIFVFAFGEMMASPTSQEYVGRVAPRDKVALYMGYYFVAVALGNLFGGILSGQFYGWLARDLQRPDLMWLCFGGIMLGTAVVFLLYNVFALPRHAADTLTRE